MKYQGSCHCGQIAFEAEGEIGELLACNCSICLRKGSLLWFTPCQSHTRLTQHEAMSTYTFNKHVIKHHFCPRCGIHPFGEGVGPNGEAMAAVNVRCLQKIYLAAFSVHHFDGRAL